MSARWARSPTCSNLDHFIARAKTACTLIAKDAAAYGWPTSVVQDGSELVRRLTERNHEIAKGTRPYAPFG